MKRIFMCKAGFAWRLRKTGWRLAWLGLVGGSMACWSVIGGCKDRRLERGGGGGQGAKQASEEPVARSARASRKVSGADFQVTRAQAVSWSGQLGVSESPSTYSAQNLYQLLDGGADRYVQKGVVRAVFVELGKGDAPVCRVTLFFLKSETAAKGLLAEEKDPGWMHYKVGDGAYGDKEGLVFRKGSIVGRVESAGPQQACPFMEVTKRIVADRSLPFAGPHE